MMWWASYCKERLADIENLQLLSVTICIHLKMPTVCRRTFVEHSQRSREPEYYHFLARFQYCEARNAFQAPLEHAMTRKRDV